jgi:hypothetical protein
MRRFSSGHSISGFRTEPLGSAAPCGQSKRSIQMAFCRRARRIIDCIEKPFRPISSHVNARHHSPSLIETSKNGMHHPGGGLFSLDAAIPTSPSP